MIGRKLKISITAGLLVVGAAAVTAVETAEAHHAHAGVSLASAQVNRAQRAGSPASPQTCNDTAYAGPFATWGPVAKSHCFILGSNGSTVRISWSEALASANPLVCAQSYSYSQKKWYSVGCGTSGSGVIPWGAVAAVPEFRAESAGTGVGIFWSH